MKLLGKVHLKFQSAHQQRIILPTMSSSGGFGRSGGGGALGGGSGGERASNGRSGCSTGTRSGGSGLEGSKGGLFVTETKAGPETWEGQVLTGGSELGVGKAETGERFDL